MLAMILNCTIMILIFASIIINDDFSYHYLMDRQSLIRGFESGTVSFSQLPDELKGDYDITLSAISRCSYNLRYASKELQNNYDIVMNAVSDCGISFQYASEELQNNYDILMVAVSTYSGSILFASEELQNNYDVVMVAVKRDGYNLKHASKKLQNNYKILNATRKLCAEQEGFPEKLKKFKNYKGWIKGHVGNDIELYNADFDVRFSYN